MHKVGRASPFVELRLEGIVHKVGRACPFVDIRWEGTVYEVGRACPSVDFVDYCEALNICFYLICLMFSYGVI